VKIYEALKGGPLPCIKHFHKIMPLVCALGTIGKLSLNRVGVQQVGFIMFQPIMGK
jgi:hypothetical protein